MAELEEVLFKELELPNLKQKEQAKSQQKKLNLMIFEKKD